MRLRPFFSYYGSAWRRAPLYPGPGAVIVEPFAGSAGYATRYPSRRVILNDSNPVICGVWRYLIRTPAAEILALPDVPAGATTYDLPFPCQEARDLAGFWLDRGRIRPCRSQTRWMRTYADRASEFWSSCARAMLARQVEAIRHWEVREGSYLDLDDLRGERATWFVDPPYQVRGGRYVHSNAGIDYEALAAWCRELADAPHRAVIVCEQEGAKWLPFGPLATVRSRAGYSREVWWGDGPQQLSLLEAT